MIQYCTDRAGRCSTGWKVICGRNEERWMRLEGLKIEVGCVDCGAAILVTCLWL